MGIQALKVYQNNNQENVENTKYSLDMLFEMNQQTLEKRIFSFDPNDSGDKDCIQYFQIKKQFIEITSTQTQILQIIDISKQTMYNIVNGEKKLLSMINATVSHEMRNPLHSIHS